MKPDTILYLIPCTLGDTAPEEVLSAAVLDVIRSLDCFIVENAKTARAFLKTCSITIPQSELIILEIDKHNSNQNLNELIDPLRKGKNAGLLSEAGVPAVADPGSAIVKLAHQHGIRVKPLTGPSSILLALMSSGMTGQRFAFHGYLPIDRTERIKTLQRLEKEATHQSQTQLFIETPYRNNALLKDICEHLNPTTRLSVAVDLTLPSEQIISKSIREWKRITADFHKKPAVFCIGE